MVQFKIGDTITLCASVWNFCGQIYQVYYIGDINTAIGTCNINIDTPDCLNLSGVQLEFQWTNGDTTSAHSCSNTSKLRVLGSGYSNSQGVVSITHIIDQTDLNLYNANLGTFDLRVCIRNKSETEVINFGELRNNFHSGDPITITENLCAEVTCSNQCINNDLWQMKCDPTTGNCIQDVLLEPNSLTCTATHNLDIYVDPHSWYTPGGAASAITNVLADVSGAIINGMAEAGLSNWTYLDTEIITEVNRVIIRIYLREITPSPPFTTYPSLLSKYSSLSSVCPEIRTLAIGPWTIIAIAIGVVIIGIGIIVGYTLYKTAITLLGETYTKEQVGEYTNDILTRMMDSCAENFPTDPVGYANCVKSGIQATTGAAQDFFNDPTIGQSGDTASDNIDACITDYNNPSSPKYHDSVALKECVDKQNQNVQNTVTNQTKSKGNPFGALLLLGAGLIGMYIISRPATAAAPIIVKEYMKEK